jgi:hypothetical protein
MASKTLFEFFEVIAQELTTEPSRIITNTDLTAKGQVATLVDDLKTETGSSTTEDAIQKAVDLLSKHFTTKGAKLPFDYDATIGRFTAIDDLYLSFVNKMASIRSVGKRSRDFEIGVAQRLRTKATGAIHRIGWPRDVKKKKKDFVKHLQDLGFTKSLLLGKEKDGGLDILWVLPIGSVPHRPILSVQCKNGVFDLGQADMSVGAGNRSLGEHMGLLANIHVPCVLFNDYLYPQRLTKKRMNFVPLGLSDLAASDVQVSLDLI